VQKAYEGCPFRKWCFGAIHRRGGSEVDRNSEAPGQTSNRQASEARERSPGEGSGQASDDEPWKAKTQGSIQRLVD
jgi:hypothetical protein